MAKKAWSLSDYQAIALQTYDMNKALIRVLDPRLTQKVLDVACGSGNGALVAGCRDCEVTGVDLISAWIERAKKRAEADCVNASFHIADAQNFPFEDGEFDVVMSVLGAIFAPDQMLWPQSFGKAIDSIESAAFLSEAQKNAIFYKNTARFLGLSE